MTKASRLVSALFVIALVVGAFLWDAPPVFSDPQQWKITSVKLCRSRSGSLASAVHVAGSYPVYSFFIPRPVWTVNGSVVEAQPVYAQGRLVEFQLLDATSLLKPGAKNTIKLSLPDQNNAKVFLFQENRILAGECYEFF
jgi:hypothetical protein